MIKQQKTLNLNKLIIYLKLIKNIIIYYLENANTCIQINSFKIRVQQL